MGTGPQARAFYALEQQKRRRELAYPEPSLSALTVEESGGVYTLTLNWDTPYAVGTNPANWLVYLLNTTNGREYWIKVDGEDRSASVDLALVGASEGDAVTVKIIGATFADSYALANALRALWQMEEAPAANRVDATGRANVLTDVNSVAQVAGAVGHGAGFDQSDNSYLFSADRPDFNPAGSFTLCGFVRPDIATGNMCVVDKWDSDNQRQQYHLYYNLAGYAKKFTFLTSSTGANEFILATAGTYEPGTRHFVAAVYDADADLMKLSIDGGAFVTLAQAAGVFISDADLTVGTSWQKSSIGNFEGMIDQLHLYHRALTMQEINRLALGLVYPEGYIQQADVTEVGPMFAQYELRATDGFEFNR